MGKISVVINTINEEENLPRAIASVKKLASEIVVVDMHSGDDTQKIAKKLGAKVFTHKRTGYVEPARNFAIGKATGEWVLVLDADEKLTSGLRKKLKKIATDSPVHSRRVNSATPGESLRADYYRLPRKNVIFGKWIKHSRFWPDYNIRFFKKGHVSWDETIHSVPVTFGKGLDLEADEENAIVHYHYKSVEQYVERLNRYTSEHAKNKVKDGQKFLWTDLIGKPANEFLSRYFQGEGYKDGIHGLAISGLQAFSEFVMYLKIWQMGKFKEEEVDIREVIDEMKEEESNIHYWQADTLLKFGGGVKHRIKRRLKL